MLPALVSAQLPPLSQRRNSARALNASDDPWFIFRAPEAAPHADNNSGSDNAAASRARGGRHSAARSNSSAASSAPVAMVGMRVRFNEPMFAETARLFRAFCRVSLTASERLLYLQKAFSPIKFIRSKSAHTSNVSPKDLSGSEKWRQASTRF